VFISYTLQIAQLLTLLKLTQMITVKFNYYYFYNFPLSKWKILVLTSFENVLYLKQIEKGGDEMDEGTNKSSELDSMTIILHIGNAKSEAYEALSAVKEGDFEKFEQKYELAKNELRIGHRAHAEMLRKLSAEERMKDVDLLMVHAEGHLSSTDIAVDMVGELGELYKWKETIDE